MSEVIKEYNEEEEAKKASLLRNQLLVQELVKIEENIQKLYEVIKNAEAEIQRMSVIHEAFENSVDPDYKEQLVEEARKAREQALTELENQFEGEVKED